MENTENQDVEDTKAQEEEHVVDDVSQEEPPIAATEVDEGNPSGSSSNEQTAHMLDGLYIEGFEKDLERCLEKTAALRALADVEPIDATRVQKPRHPNPICLCPTLGDEEETQLDNERSSAPLSPAQSAPEAQSEATQVDQELGPERQSHVFVVPKLAVKRQPIVGLTVKTIDSKTVTVVVDDPVKPPPDAKLSFLKLFTFADTMDYFLMFLGSLGACAHGVAVPIFFVFFGRLINAFGFNQHHPHRLAQEVGKEALSMFYLGLVVMFASWMEVACWMQTGERQSARIRVRYLQSVLSQDVGYFDTNANTAEIVGHIAQDISLVQDAISEKIVSYEVIGYRRDRNQTG
ncbi:hypothetical protein M758_6G043500 [Ceratodon purpureus]|nr:hypothetical protein M758_6G043500 [Ceratodon purpureus]